MQELTQALKAGGCYAFLDPFERRDGRICRVSTPGFKVGLRFSDRSSLAMLIRPETVPVDQKVTGDAEISTARLFQEGGYYCLLRSGEVFRPAQQEEAVLFEQFAQLLDLFPAGPGRWR